MRRGRLGMLLLGAGFAALAAGPAFARTHHPLDLGKTGHASTRHALHRHVMRRAVRTAPSDSSSPRAHGPYIDGPPGWYDGPGDGDDSDDRSLTPPGPATDNPSMPV